MGGADFLALDQERRQSGSVARSANHQLDRTLGQLRRRVLKQRLHCSRIAGLRNRGSDGRTDLAPAGDRHAMRRGAVGDDVAEVGVVERRVVGENELGDVWRVEREKTQQAFRRL